MSIQEALYNSETKCVEASCLRISSGFNPPEGQRNVLRRLMARKKNMKFEKRDRERKRMREEDDGPLCDCSPERNEKMETQEMAGL